MSESELRLETRPEFADEELVRDFQKSGDLATFELIVKRYQSPLRAWLRQLCGGNEAEADDLAQRTFICACEQIRKFEGRARFSTWLFQIAFNFFRMENRKEGRMRAAHQHYANEVATVGFSSTSAPDLEYALSRITPEQRMAVTLCCSQGFTHDEASRILKTPVGTIKTNIARGKEELRKLLSL